MTNKQVIFADRLVGIAIHGNTVRLDYGIIAGTRKDKDGKPVTQVEVHHQLVLPLEAFAQSVEAQAKLVKQLMERGKKRREGKAGDPAVEGKS